MRSTGTSAILLALLLLLPAMAAAQVPTLSSLLPTASNNNAATAVSITGTGFLTATSVNFTGPATVNVTSANIAIVDANNLVCVVPTNTMPIGVYTVRVTNATGASTQTLSFQVTANAPEIDTVSPSAGGNNAAFTIDLAGRNYTGVSAVQLIGPVTRSLTFNIQSSTAIRATVPAALPGGTYRVRAVGPNGPSNDDITYRVDDARTSSTAVFVDQFGNPRTSYAIGVNPVFVQVTDRDKDTDSGSQQTVTVRVTDSATGDSEVITLTETGSSSGVFRNSGGVTGRSRRSPARRSPRGTPTRCSATRRTRSRRR
jgi:methionine-rich copper-binding protein CopC